MSRTADIDSLIDELGYSALYPGDRRASGQQHPSTTPMQRQSSFDDPSPTTAPQHRGGLSVSSSSVAPMPNLGAAAGATGKGKEPLKSPGHAFDDSDEDDSTGAPSSAPPGPSSGVGGGVGGSAFTTGRSPVMAAKTHMPFPTLPSSSVCVLALVCQRLQCTLSSCLTGRLPPFHMHYAGGGACEGVTSLASAGFAGATGCLYIQCLHCDQLVVRRQGAAWQDGDGALDLYLAMRYHYPDWAAFPPNVLDRDPCRAGSGVRTAAAYCCQCSWFTVVDNTAFVLDAPLVVAPHGSRLTRSTQQAGAGGGKTFPRWVCKGHPL